MRLLDIKRYINIAYENFKPDYSNSNVTTHYLYNVLNLKIAIQALYDSGIMVYSYTEINAYTLIMSSMTDRLVLDANQYNAFKKELEKLKYTISVLHSWISRYVPTEETEDIINIKLPVIKDMASLVKSCAMIDKALTQSVSEFGGEIKFKQLDYGSSWITISAATSAAAAFIMGLSKAAFYVAKKYYAIKLMSKEYERYSMATDIMRTLKEVNEKIIKEEISKKAEEIEKEYYPNEKSEPERVGRLRNAINELTKLIELGGEIHPSAILEDTSEDKIDYKLLSSMFSQGLLTDGKSKESNENEEK